MVAQAPQNLTSSFIKSRLLNVAQTSFYGLTMPLPEGVQRLGRSRGLKVAGSLNDLTQIELLCHEASLPGSSLATHDVTNDYAGVTEKMAYRRIYDAGLNLTFYVDRDYHAIELFETWIDFITGGEDRGLSKSRHRNYRMRYPEQYRQEIFITKFEKDQHSNLSERRKNIINYTFVGAFPQNITAMPVSYNVPDILKVNVSFSYIRYVSERSLMGARPRRSDTMRSVPAVRSISSSKSTAEKVSDERDPYVDEPTLSMIDYHQAFKKDSFASMLSNNQNPLEKTFGGLYGKESKEAARRNLDEAKKQGSNFTNYAFPF